MPSSLPPTSQFDAINGPDQFAAHFGFPKSNTDTESDSQLLFPCNATARLVAQAEYDHERAVYGELARAQNRGFTVWKFGMG